MKVLHAYKIYPPDADGGIPQVIRMLAGTESRQITSFVLVARDRGSSKTYALDGIPVRAAASIGTMLSMPLAPTYPFTLRALGKRVDVIVHHAPFPLTDLGILLGLRRNIALVIYWHAEIVGRRFLLRLLAPLIRAALRRADRIIVSDGAMLTDSAFLKIHRSKCVVIPYGLDVNYWSALEQSDHASIAELKGRYPSMVLAVGRLVSYKGFDVLLDALISVEAQLIIIGEGPMHRDLEAQAVKSGLAHRVHFLGRLSSDEVKQYMHACRVFVLPSVTEAEAFGLVQVEAMAAGRAVINTDLPTAVPGVARHNLEGLTVPAKDSAALATAINKLLGNPELAEKLGRAGRSRAHSEFECSAYRRRIESVFEDAIRDRTEKGVSRR